MRNILVIGGAGFIGSHLVDRLVGLGHKVTVYDSLDSHTHPDGKPPLFLNPDSVFVKGDILDYNHIKRIVKDKNVIFHLASLMDPHQYGIKKFLDTNMGGVTNLMDILVNSEHCCEKLIFASSITCYGEGEYECPECGNLIVSDKRSDSDIDRKKFDFSCEICAGDLIDKPTVETKYLNPVKTDGLSHKIQEDIILSLGKSEKIPVTVLRYSNVYGVRSLMLNPYTWIFPYFVNELMEDRSPEIFEDGNQGLDFVHVADVVNANILAMDNDLSDYNVYNIGSGYKQTVLGLFSEIRDIVNAQSEPRINYLRNPNDVRHCYLDISKAKQDLSYVPVSDRRSEMIRFVNWLREKNSVDIFRSIRPKLNRYGIV